MRKLRINAKRDKAVFLDWNGKQEFEGEKGKFTKYDVAANLFILGDKKLWKSDGRFLDDIKLKQRLQKAMFGYVPFGKKTIRFDSDKEILDVIERVGFGQDANRLSFNMEEAAKVLNKKGDFTSY